MRIERIRSVNLTGLGDVDWTFPRGPVLLFSEDRSRQGMLGNLLLELFYDSETPLASKDQSRKGLVEVWMTGSSTRFHVRREFVQKGDELERSLTLEIEDETGQQVSLPETMTLGEYIFLVKLRAFRQSAIVEWPENKESDHFFQLVRNLRQGGDAELSLTKVRASMAGAQKRVKDQTESMLLVKAEYDALRCEWEAAHRQQEEERLLMIEIRNLQEKKTILAERITTVVKIQERLALLRQNPDYRKLRQLQGELIWLEERYRELESNFNALTSESQVDWAVIESLREECMEWAYLQEQVGRLTAEAQVREQKIYDIQNLLQTSGYQGLPEDEVQRLRRAEKERYAAQEELDKLIIRKNELAEKQKLCTEEIKRLQGFAVLAEVTEAAEIKIAQRERHLAQWQSSKMGSFLDRALRKRFERTSIAEMLEFRLSQYYQNYNVSNFTEFTNQLKEFRNQRQLVEKLQMESERLQKKVSREENLRRIVHSRDEILKQAFTSVKVVDFPAWLSGWEDHQQKKHQLTLWLEELRLEQEQQQIEENKMAATVELLREKLGNWGTLATDRDEVLATVLKVASQLRAKDKAEREFTDFSQRFYDLLGDRNIEHLAKILEPLADLEREVRPSDEDGLAELAERQKELEETRRQLEAAEQLLQGSPKFLAFSVLEKKIETVKRQWIAFEDLQRALADAKALLESSWQEWQTKYGKVLNEEKQRIFSWISSSPAQETIGKDVADARKNYFAYRMAIAQLALGDNFEVPLLFSVGEMNEGESFWKEITGYLRKLALSRQVVLCTSDAKLFQKLAATGWQRLNNTTERLESK